MRILSVLFVIFASTSTPSRAQESACLPADDGAVVLTQFANHLITSTDSLERELSKDLGLVGIKTSELTQITKGNECARAAAVMDSLAKTPNSGRRVYLLKAGARRFFVKDPKATAGEWSTSFLFDNDWKLIRVLLGG